MSLSEDERTQIGSSLAKQLQHIRSMPSEGYYGRVHRQGWRSRIGLLRIDGRKLRGPYDNYDDFVSAMYATAELHAARLQVQSEWSPALESTLSIFKSTLAACTGRQPTLTHLDPGLYNIIVRKVQGTEKSTKEWEAILIDWAEFGWYPAWMQSVAFNGQITMWTDKKGVDFTANKEFCQMVMGGLDDPYLEQVELFDLMYRRACYALM